MASFRPHQPPGCRPPIATINATFDYVSDHQSAPRAMTNTADFNLKICVHFVMIIDDERRPRRNILWLNLKHA